MSPIKTVATGVFLLLVAMAGLIYVVARPKPLVQALQPEAIPAIEAEQPEATPAPTPEEEPTVQSVDPPPVVQLQTPQPKTFAVKLLSPLMAQTFVAPATVKLAAAANYRSDLKSIEFYTGPFGISVCQSLTNPEPFGTKIGEALTPPYEFTWSEVDAGNYNIVAVANYQTGEQQLSEPTVIVVNKTANYDGPEWIGWRPPYSDEGRAGQEQSLTPPIPVPSLSDCPAITVKSLGLPASLKGPVTFSADLSGNIPKDVTYRWTVSAGQIVSGEEASSMTVDVNTLLEESLVASLEVGKLNAICPNTASTRVSFVQPRWINASKRSLLLDLRLQLDPFIQRPDDPDAQVYIFAEGDNEDCVDSEVLEEARLVKRYLMEVGGYKSSQIFINNGGKIQHGMFHRSNVEVLSKTGSKASDGLNEALRLSATRGVRPCQSRLMTEVRYLAATPINRKCPDVEDRIFFRTKISGGTAINTCPYNVNDPQNTNTQMTLWSETYDGTYGSNPSFRYWVTGGKILNNGPNGIWDLSSVKLRPGMYTAIAQANDGCDCTSTEDLAVRVTNLCTPCLTLKRYCDPDAPEKRQLFAAYVGDFALTREATFQWVTSKGTIIAGQGTARVTVDTSGLPPGEEFDVTVRTGGLMGYCVNRLSIKGIVGNCPVQVDTPVMASPLFGTTRRARRQPPQVEAPPPIVGSAPAEGPEAINTLSDKVGPKLNEKEWMSVSWSPRVKSDENFSVTVTYNRTTEAIQLTSADGELSEELKLGGRFKSLRERYGPDYEVFANARLVVAGIECSTCAQEQYQSLDREKVEWSWPVSPSGKGTQVFNVELWVKAEPRDKQSGRQSMGAEKVWSRNNLKVEVAETILTRNNVLAGGSLCAVLGLGLCVRGLKIYRVGDTYNVGQAVAVGRNVTMNNTTVNQEAPKQDAESGGNK